MERFGVERRSVEIETAGEFRGEVLGISGAAAVATEVDLATMAQRFNHHIRRLLDAVLKIGIIQNCLLGNDTVLNGLGNAWRHHEHLLLWVAKI